MENTKVAKCVIKYLRIGPRKARIVLNAIQHKGTRQALFALKTMNKKAARFAFQGLTSAIANAKVLKMDLDKLYVAEAKADTGSLMKRFMARSMGRADRMVRRTTHITIVVREGKKNINGVPGEVLKKDAVSQTPASLPRPDKKNLKEAKEKNKTASKKQVGAKS